MRKLQRGAALPIAAKAQKKRRRMAFVLFHHIHQIVYLRQSSLLNAIMV